MTPKAFINSIWIKIAIASPILASIIYPLIIDNHVKQVRHDKVINQILVFSENGRKKVQYYLRNNVDSALSSILTQKELALNTNNRQLLAQSYIDMSELNILTGNFQFAKNDASTALKILHQDVNQVMTVRGLIALGKAEDKLFKTVKATRYLHGALKIANNMKNTQLKCDANIALGVVSGNNRNLSQAIYYFKNALKLAHLHHLDQEYLVAMYGLGVTYSMNGNIKLGLSYLTKALRDCNKSGNDILKTKILLNIAKSQLELNNKQLALAYYKQTKIFAKSNGLKDQIAMAILGIAVSMDNPSSSPKYFYEALKMADLTGNKLIRLGILQNLAAFHKKHGPNKDAITYLEQYHQLKDSIFTIQKSTQIAELEAVNDLQQSRSHLHQMEIRLLKSRQEKKFNIIVSISLSTIIIIIAFCLNRQRILIQKINQERANASQLNEMNERILKILGHDLVGPMSALNAMLYLLQQNGLDENEKHTLISQLILAQEQTIDTLDKVLKWGNQRSQIMDIQKSQFDAFEHIIGIIELLQPLAIKHKIRINLLITKKTTLFTDPTHFDFILRNVIQNAIKFSRTNAVVEIGIFERTDHKLTLYVYNQGNIFTAKELALVLSGGHIQSDKILEKHGTGLGLRLSHELLIACGGNLSILPTTYPGTKIGITYYLG